MNREVQEDRRLAGLRAEVRGWLKTNVPEGWRERQSGDDIVRFVECQRDWLGRLAAAGYATPHWTKEWPGGGRPLDEQIVIFEEIARAGAPRMSLFFVSLYHAAMTLIEWGSEAQKSRHLPAILAGEIWCQGFSEPNAGSDLASLKCRAERRGDHYFVTGQKIWSTLGQFADWCLLLVRTSSEGPKQTGITYLLLDMKTPGVDVRPIRQITGDEEFAEIFLDDVKIPIENLVGEEGCGWQVAQTTLASERGLTLVEMAERLTRSMRLLTRLSADGDPYLSDPEFRRAVVYLSARVEGLRAMVSEVMQRRMKGSERVGDASIIKLAYSRILREFDNLGMRMSGVKALLDTHYTLGAGFETGNWIFDFGNSYQWNIAGGTNEIQRNIISERMLALPREAGK